ncbi:MAG TPA: amino acid permease [Steroidobacteraceae bacterium]|nr:amino acid permease [Steroidobacteraceae bacterium]
MSIWARKSIDVLVSEAESSAAAASGLRRSLGLWNLTSIGVGCTIGAGIFVLTGTAAATYAGPAVSLSFLLAALACLFAALCYAELAAMIPVSGSAYTYAYATLGELVAWIIGWNLILEYLISASTVAVGWSGYFSALLQDYGLSLPAALTTPPLARSVAGHWIFSGVVVNVPAVGIVLALTAALSAGIRSSAIVNNAMVLVKVLVIVLVIACGVWYVNADNWTPFVPANTGEPGSFGWSGVVRAAGIVFFAYIGFDAVSTSAQEAKNPRRDVPLALLITIGVCTALYIAMTLVMTGMAHYTKLNVPHPVFEAVNQAGPALAWLKPVISIGAVVGLASAILTTLYGQIRIFYAMGRDGIIPPSFARIHERLRVPVQGTWYCGIGAAAIAGVFPIELLGELASIGTLLAFAIVCLGVLALRYARPDAPRPFRVPCGVPVSIVGAAVCVWLMLSLPSDTWVRLAAWLALGFAIYFGYGYRNSRLRAPPDQTANGQTVKP